MGIFFCQNFNALVGIVKIWTGSEQIYSSIEGDIQGADREV